MLHSLGVREIITDQGRQSVQLPPLARKEQRDTSFPARSLVKILHKVVKETEVESIKFSDLHAAM